MHLGPCDLSAIPWLPIPPHAIPCHPYSLHGLSLVLLTLPDHRRLLQPLCAASMHTRPSCRRGSVRLPARMTTCHEAVPTNMLEQLASLPRRPRCQAVGCGTRSDATAPSCPCPRSRRERCCSAEVRRDIVPPNGRLTSMFGQRVNYIFYLPLQSKSMARQAIRSAMVTCRYLHMARQAHHDHLVTCRYLHVARQAHHDHFTVRVKVDIW